MNNERFEIKIIYCITILVLLFFILPFILFGTKSIITIHDSLDQLIPYYKMYKDNALFFKFDVPTKGFSGMSTLYYGFVDFSFTPLLYQIFNDFLAYSINYYVSILIGFFSMCLLLKKIKIIRPLAVLISVCYAVLPVVPTYSIAISTLPLIIYVFLYFASGKNTGFSWRSLLLLFFPPFSLFTGAGIFILGLWFFGFMLLWIKNKKLNINLLAGFLALCIGYILVNVRLFYVMFVLKTSLNRSIFNTRPIDIFTQIRVFLSMLKVYGAHGHYHVSTLQRKIVIPTAFFTSMVCLLVLIKRIIKTEGKPIARIKKAVMESERKVKLLFTLEAAIFLFSCIAALYESGIMNSFISKYIPLLDGFNWGRIWVFNRVLWYVIFGLCLQLFLKIDYFSLEVKINNLSKTIQIPAVVFRLCVLAIICLQLKYIMLTPGHYTDQASTWFNQLSIAKKIMPNPHYGELVSYKEFYSKEQFDEIKADISYSDEPVVALGYHPSVLMYNGFNCIDGYNNAYPLSYMQRFRTLIAPEFEKNQKDRDYYDSWGGRMYLYNSELSHEPTRNKNTSPVKLNIDINVFINDFGGRYILSRAKITNTDELGLKLVKRYEDEKSIYTIYLYEALALQKDLPKILGSLRVKSLNEPQTSRLIKKLTVITARTNSGSGGIPRR